MLLVRTDLSNFQRAFQKYCVSFRAGYAATWLMPGFLNVSPESAWFDSVGEPWALRLTLESSRILSQLFNSESNALSEASKWLSRACWVFTKRTIKSWPWLSSLQTHLFELAGKVKGMWDLRIYPVQSPFFLLQCSDQEPTWAEGYGQWIRGHILLHKTNHFAHHPLKETDHALSCHVKIQTPGGFLNALVMILSNKPKHKRTCPVPLGTH